MRLPILGRPRPLDPEQKTRLVEAAVKVARDPRLLGTLEPSDRNRVDELSKALGNAHASFHGPRASRQPRPIPAQALAQRAAASLQPSSSITPADIEAAMLAQGLDMVAPFAPGSPLTPYYGYGRQPRIFDYEIARNTTTQTRPDRIPFETLLHLWKAYDVAQACTRYSINDLRSMRVRFTAMEGHEDNPVKEIAEAKRFLRKPDGKRFFRNWLAINQRNLWIFDSAPIYRYKVGGKLTRLINVSAMTIAPMIDYFGDIPEGAAPAYQQFIEGVPWDWLNAEDIIYEPFWPETDSPYGTPPLETVLVNANTDLRLQMYFLDFFTKGAIPEMIAIAPEGMTDPDAIAELEETYDAWTQGDQAERWGLRWLPNGTELEPYKPDHFDPDLAEYVMRRTVAAYGLTPQNLGILDDVNRACYSDDTETLTENGWKRYHEVLPGEKIATFNPDTKELEFHVPEKLYTYPYEGDMVRFASRQVDCLVTPDHKMWVGRATTTGQRRNGPAWAKVDAEALERAGDFWFADSVVWTGGTEEPWFTLPAVERGRAANHLHDHADRTIPMDVWLEFLGYVVSEGCIFGDASDGRYKVSVSQNERANPEKTRTIEACISELPFAFRSYVDSGATRRWQVSDKALWTWLRSNVGHYSADKRLPDLWRTLPKRQLGILFDALMLGDGTVPTKPNHTGGTYFTKSESLADDVQELALRLGYRAARSVNRVGGVYRVHLTDPRPMGYQLRWAKNAERVAYSGTVWCFHVPPNHLFLTRRNGKVTIAGNTSDTQTDQQFRVSTLPVVGYYEDLLDSVLQDDLSLPVQVRFDTGREKEDRLNEAKAWSMFVDMGAASPDEPRDKVLGLPIDPENPTPRSINSQRLGPVPLTYVQEISGPVDALTFAPSKKPVYRDYVVPGSNNPDPIEAANGQDEAALPVAGNPKAQAPKGASRQGSSAASKEARPGLMPGAPEPNAVANPEGPQNPDEVGYGWFDSQGSAAQGTAAIRERDDLAKWRANARKAVAKGKAPRRFADSQIRPGVEARVWEALKGATSREDVDWAFKTAQPQAAGVVVQAADTGRVLMVQRTPDKHDPQEAYARWEWPGGKLDHDGDTPWSGGLREWSEETGAALPDSFEHVGNWTSPDGVYVGFVVTIPSEADIDLDPDGQEVSNARWWDKADLDDPKVRDKVTDTLDRVTPMLKGWADQPRGRGAKWRTQAHVDWEQFHRHTDRIVEHYAPLVQEAMAHVVDPAAIRQALDDAYTRPAKITKAAAHYRVATLPGVNCHECTFMHPDGTCAKVKGKVAADHVCDLFQPETAEKALGDAWRTLLANAQRAVQALRDVLARIYGDGYMQGSHEAAQASGGEMPPWTATVTTNVDWSTWNPELGDAAARAANGGLAQLLSGMDVWIKEMTDTQVNRIGDAIAEGIREGFPVRKVQAEIDRIVNDADRAHLIAETEYARAVGQAAMDTYRLNNVPEVTWLAEPTACPRCKENQAASPQPTANPRWPNGPIPVHPNERCAVAPLIRVPTRGAQ